MINYLENLSARHLNIIRAIGKRAEYYGAMCFVAGGVVRDLMLKNKVLDLDLVLSKDVIRFVKMNYAGLNNRIKVYPQFKTASVLIDGINIDFSTLRSEAYVRPGALPTIDKGSIASDLFRRDFTVNAMLISINKPSFGELIDLYGGFNDLRQKKIRILHDQSFVDDPTRIYRAVRFEKRLGFNIEQKTLKLLKEALRGRNDLTVGPKRRFTELIKILNEPNYSGMLKRLKDVGGLNFVDNEFKLELRRLNTVNKRYPKEKRLINYEKWQMLMLALMENQKNDVQQRFIKTYSLNQEFEKTFLQFKEIKTIMKSLARSSSRSRVYLLLKTRPKLLVEYLLLRVGKNVNQEIKWFLLVGHCVKPLLNGNDLRRLGICSGEMVGKYLEKMKTLEMDGKIKRKSQAIKYIKNQLVEAANGIMENEHQRKLYE